QQARCLFHKELFFLVGFSPVSNRQDACSTKSYFFLMDRHYQHNFFPKRRQVRYDVISRSVLAGSSR
ncbi:hypothetical protein, partial [Microcoleus sp. B13-B6]|uniref:hypothetical protein n=1 Tax=Microcoleus sp. B13-B6 TaxID=2818652 RepID=UPI002FD6E1F0